MTAPAVKRPRGRPALPPGTVYTVRLEQRLADKARAIGGKVTRGIRIALEKA